MSARDARILNSLCHALQQAWNAGSPVAGQDAQHRARRAHIALRRIESFDKRRIAYQDRQSAARDLAKGLIEAFEKNLQLVGPLSKDYQWLAGQLLNAYAAVPPDPVPVPEPGLLDDLLSRDATRIWSAASAIRRLRDTEQLARLAAKLDEIRAATQGVELGGALRPNSSHLEFALKKLEFTRDARGCLCALYEMDGMYDPEQERTDGHVRIVGTVNGERWVDHYECECTQCAQRFRVEPRASHYTWWQWTKDSVTTR